MVTATHCLVLTLKSERFSQTNLSSVKTFVCAGSKLPINSALEFSKHLPNGVIVNVYGMSEMAGTTAMGLVTAKSNGSVGCIQVNTQAKIVDEDGNAVGENEYGEIHLKPAYPFLGYLKNEKATLNSLDEDGFFKTGDIGYFDSDSGTLFLVDRNKEMIKYCSSQIAPSEIEEHLIQHPSIKAVCVVGIPDQEAGELPAAVIVKQNDDAPISRDDVKQMVAGKIFVFYLVFCRLIVAYE